MIWRCDIYEERRQSETVPSVTGSYHPPAGVHVKGAVDLDGVKPGGVALKRTSYCRECMSVLPWDAPACRADPEITHLRRCLLSAAPTQRVQASFRDTEW